MSRELRRIQRLRDLRGYREKAAQRDLAKAQSEVIETQRGLDACRDDYGDARERVLQIEEITPPDFEMERLRVLMLSKRVDRAEDRLQAMHREVDARKVGLAIAHREVEQMNRWKDLTKTVIQEDERRIDRFESDEIAARTVRKT